MNNQGFNARTGLIFVDTEITGPLGSTFVELVLDTGATTSLINRDILISSGFDPDQSPRKTSMTTGSTVEIVPLVVLTRFSALGQHRFGLSVIAHPLPTDSTLDGLLGLDFLRGQILTIDFQSGRIILA